MRGFAGTLLREGLPGSAGIFVTLSDFTKPARSEAKANGIALVDNHDLNDRIEKARRIELCPVCQDAMVLDRSARGLVVTRHSARLSRVSAISAVTLYALWSF